MVEREKSQEQIVPLHMLFVGDVMLGRLVNEVLEEKEPGYPWGDTLALFRRADVRFCNLECALCTRETPRPTTFKLFRFRSDAKNVEALKQAHIDAVSLANNHTLDFGTQGLFQTARILEEEGIRVAGAGKTLREASTPAIWSVKGRTIGLLAFTDNEPEWAATEEQPGVWYVPVALQEPRAQYLFEIVKRTRGVVDLLVVSAHWGPNWGYSPEEQQIPFAHALIEAGADVIFGHSGHIVRGIEVYQKKPILYCTGDFIDDYAVDDRERNDRSCLFIIEYTGTTLSRLFLYPTVIQTFQAQRAQHHEERAIAAMMQHLCAEFHTTAIWNEQEKRLEISLL